MDGPTETDADGAPSPAVNTSSSRKKRNLPGNPDPDAEVVALSPRTLMATNRYICEVCHKGFQRDQNLQLHRRGHNLPWKLKQRPGAAQSRKRVFVCPEPSCVHHHPARALGDLTGIKKHYCRKHGDKKWKCDKCSKRYAVQSDWKAHSKICGMREYRCDCGTIFSRKDSFVTHRAFCDALSEESHRANRDVVATTLPSSTDLSQEHAVNGKPMPLSSHEMMMASNLDPFYGARTLNASSKKASAIEGLISSSPLALGSAYTSATALLQKAAEMGSNTSHSSLSPILLRGFTGYFTGNRNLTNKSQQASSAAGFNEPPAQISTAPYGVNLETPKGRDDIAEMGLYDLSVLMNSSGGNSGGILLREEEKMTVDYLGVAPPAFSSRGRDDEVPQLGSMRESSMHDMHSQW